MYGMCRGKHDKGPNLPESVAKEIQDMFLSHESMGGKNVNSAIVEDMIRSGL